MKAVCVTRTFDEQTKTPGAVECLEVEKPRITDPDDVLIRIAYASICGSDVHYIKDNLLSDLFPSVPFQVGHEVSGIIEDLGSKAAEKGLRIGDHVTGNFVLECGHCEACRNGERQFCKEPYVNGSAQAEYIVWKADQTFKISPTIPLDEAALIEPFNIAVGAMHRSGFKSSDTAFVLGAGSIGQMLIQLLKKSGASMVGASARTASKRDMALKMGADFVVDSVNQNIFEEVSYQTDSRGYDIVFEMSGNAECAAQAMEIVRPGGCIVMVSYYPPGTKIQIELFEKIVSKGITIKGLQLAQNSWIQSLKLFPGMDFRPLISKIYPLEECKQAYQDLVSGKYMKILFSCMKNKYKEENKWQQY